MTTAIKKLQEAIHLQDHIAACPYLDDKVATLQMGDGYLAGQRYRELLDLGYRRSGGIVYRPACQQCQECQVLRVPVAGFNLNKEQRRVWKRGAGVFQAELHPPSYTDEKFLLYRKYLRYQHGNENPSETPEDYERFLVQSCLGGRTFEMQFHAKGRLAGVGILDQVGDALSSVYFFFDPDLRAYSPGTYSALYEIELARRWKLKYYYLGYYIRECASMSYKLRFQPCELLRLDGSEWETVAR